MHRPALNLPNTFTIEAWVYPTATAGMHGSGILAKGVSTNGNAASYELLLAPNSTRPFFRIFAGGTEHTLIAPPEAACPLNQWCYIAGTYDGAALRLWVDPATSNGDLWNTAALWVSTTPEPNSGNLVLGTRRPSFSPGNFVGRIDDVRIWNVALSETQLQDVRRDPLTGAEEGLVAMYRLDHVRNLGVGNPGVNDLTDAGPNGFHGDLIGTGATFGDPRPTTVRRDFNVTASDNTTEERVDITWLSVPANVTNVRLLRDGRLLATLPRATTSFEDRTGGPTVRYTYCVMITLNGREETWGCDGGFRDFLPPSNVVATDNTFGDRVRISWRDESNIETGYVITRNGDVLVRLSANASVFNDLNAVAGQTYTYCVVATSGEFTGAPVCDTGTRALVAPPMAVQASDGLFPDRVAVGWTLPTGLTPDPSRAFSTNAEQYFSAPHNPAFNVTDSLTLEAWVFLTANPIPFQAAGVISKGIGPDGNAASYEMLLLDDRRVYFRLSTFAGIPDLTSAAAIPLNAWTHVAATYDGQRMRVFINGQQDGEAAWASTIVPNSLPLILAARGTASGVLPGHIDDARIWRRVLSASEIQGQRMSTLTGLERGLVAGYRFDAQQQLGVGAPGANDMADVGPSGLHATRVTQNVTFASPRTGAYADAGVTARALDLSGERFAYVPHNPILNLTTGVTMEAWINLTAQPHFGNGAGILSKGVGWDGNAAAYELLLLPDRRLFARFTLSTGVVALASPEPIPLNMWTHVAASYDGSQIRLFVNSTQVATQAATGSIQVNSGFLGLGVRGVYSGFFPGQIDDVRLWDHARDPFWIGHDANIGFNDAQIGGLIGSWRFDAAEWLGVGGAGPNDLRNSSATELHAEFVDLNATFTEARPGLGVELRRRVANASPATDLFLGAFTTETSYNDQTVEDGVTYTYCARRVTGSGPSVEVCDNGNAGGLPVPTNVTATVDVHDDRIQLGWRDNATVESGYRVYRNTGASLNFDGVNDALPTDPLLYGRQAWTFSAWVFVPELPTSAQALYKESAAPNAGGRTLTIFLENGTLRAYAWVDGPGYIHGVGPAGALRLGWNFVAITARRGQPGILYVNETRTSTEFQPGQGHVPSGRAQFGADYFEPAFFNGRLDEVRMWSRALSEAEVRQFQFASPPETAQGLLREWRFDEGTGPITIDAAGGNTLFIGDGSADRPSWAASDAGVDRYGTGLFASLPSGADGRVTVPNPLTGSGDFTIEFWVWPDALNTGGAGSRSIMGRGTTQRSALELWTTPYNNGLTMVYGDFVQDIGWFFRGARQWAHVAFVKEGTTLRLFRDGQLMHTATGVPSTYPIADGQLSFGFVRRVDGVYGQQPFHGFLDELRIWNRARTEQELRAARFRTLVGNEAGLAGYWPLDRPGRGTGLWNEVTDRTSGARHGTFSHGASFLSGPSPLPVGLLPEGAVAFSDAGPAPGVGARYRVEVFTDGGSRASANEVFGRRAFLLPPTDVVATDSTHETRVVLSWKAGSQATSLFRVYRRVAHTGADFTLLDFLPISKTDYTDENLAPGLRYEYCVTAVTAEGVESARSCDFGSREVKAPTRVQAEDDANEASVRITWVDNSQAESGFRVYRRAFTNFAAGTLAPDSVLVGSTLPNITSLIDAAGIAGITYRYSVVAHSMWGDPAATAVTSSSTDAGRRVLRTPARVIASKGQSESHVELTWSDLSRAERGYRIYRWEAGSASSTAILLASTEANVQLYRDVNTQIGIRYNYAVAPFDNLGEGAWSESDLGFTSLSAPVSVRASQDYVGMFTLSWEDVSARETGYQWQMEGRDPSAVLPSGTTFVHHSNAFGASLELGRSYRVCVWAVAGGGIESERVCTQAHVAAPPAPVQSSDLLFPEIEPDGEIGSGGYGVTVALAGNFAYVGAPADNQNSGALYILERTATGWRQYDKIPSPGGVGDRFGHAVTTSGDYVAVSAPFADVRIFMPSAGNPNPPVLQDAGAVYIYRRTTSGSLEFVQRVVLPTEFRTQFDGTRNFEAAGYFPRDPIRFGWSISMSGDALIVGTPHAVDHGPTTPRNPDGMAAIFHRNATNRYQVEAIFWGGWGGYGAAVGYASWVAISGKHAVISVPGNNPGQIVLLENVGEADGRARWVWRGHGVHDAFRPDWNNANLFDFVNGNYLDLWAIENIAPVAISGNIIVNARPGRANRGSLNEGIVSVQRIRADGTLEHLQWIESPVQGTDDRFGWSLSLGERELIITGGPVGQRRVHRYARQSNDTFALVETLRGPYHFGWSTAVAPQRLLIGEPFKPRAGVEWRGSVHFREYEPEAPALVTASDMRFENRVELSWTNHAIDHTGVLVFRDEDREPIAQLSASANTFIDYDAVPGEVHLYCVVADNAIGKKRSSRQCDFGGRRAEGSVTGRVAFSDGRGVAGAPVCLDPAPNRSLQLDGIGSGATSNVVLDNRTTWTFEAWIFPTRTDSSSVIYSEGDLKDGRRDVTTYQLVRSLTGELVLRINGQTTGDELRSATGLVPVGTWTHVVAQRDGTRYRLMVNGVLVADKEGVGFVELESHRSSIGIATGRTWPADGRFRGQIDEVRIWSTARTDVQIRQQKRVVLEDAGAALVVRWSFDEVLGRYSLNTSAPGNHVATLLPGTHFGDRGAPLNACVQTAQDGGFAFRGIRYGETTTYRLSVQAEGHTFDPPVLPVTLTRNNPAVNNVVVTDRSQFLVRGRVRIEQTANGECYLPNVSMYLDDSPISTTDEAGVYALSGTPGVRTLRPLLDGVAFDPASRTLQLRRDTSNVNFVVTTVRRLQGRFGGPLGRTIGVATLRIRSEDGCFTREVVTQPDGGISVLDLPPLRYVVSVIDVSNFTDTTQATEIRRYFRNLGGVEVDLTRSDQSIDLRYRAPIEVDIRRLPAAHPDLRVPILQGIGGGVPNARIPVEIFVGENYGGGTALVPVDSAEVVLFDEISDRERTPRRVVVRNGIARDTLVVGFPNVTRGRVVNGEDRSYQKYYRAVATAGARQAETTAWAIVTGAKPREGADFVTEWSEIPTLILRDPPGDASYSFLQREQAHCMFIGGAVEGWMRVVLGALTAFGVVDTEVTGGFFGVVGAAAEMNTYIYADGEIGGNVEISLDTDNTLCWSSSTEISTSDSPDFIGRDADVIGGVGLNLSMSLADEVVVEGTDILTLRRLMLMNRNIRSAYLYTYAHIRDVLIPQFELLSEIDPVNRGRYVRSLEGWRGVLAMTDSLSQIGADMPAADGHSSRSFVGGTRSQHQFTDSRENSVTTEVRVSTWLRLKVGALFRLVPAHAEAWLDTEIGSAISIRGGYGNNASTTWGYVLSDDDVGDAFWLNVKRDPVYGTPIFDVQAGRSSRPYEPWRDTSGRARVMARDLPRLSTPLSLLESVPPDQPAVFDIQIENLSATDEDRVYNVALLNETNRTGATVTLNGQALNAGVRFMVPAGGVVNARLAVRRGPDSFRMDDLGLVVYPAGDEENWRLEGSGQADTLLLSARWRSPSSPIVIDSPQEFWTISGTQTGIDVTVADFTLVPNDIGAETAEITLLYRRVGAEHWDQAWTATRTQIINWHRNRNSALPLSQMTSYTQRWNVAGLVDGRYELRALTRATLPGGASVSAPVYSPVVLGTLDRTPPAIEGVPEPADGILSLGETVSFRFNEPIQCSSVIISGDGQTVRLLRANGAQVPFTVACSEESVHLTLTTLAELESQTLTAVVAGIRDRVGNTMAQPRQWSFVVRQADFAWTVDRITLALQPDRDGSFQVVLANGQTAAASWSFAEGTLPSWLRPSITGGTLQPRSTQTITFSVLGSGRPTTAVSQTVRVIAEAAIAEFVVEVIPPGPGSQFRIPRTPQWSITPALYAHTMSVTAQLFIDGVVSLNAGDRVAAFVGNEVRGVTNVVPTAGSNGIPAAPGQEANGNRVNLLIYSNLTEGEVVTFRVYDAARDTVFTTASPTLVFNASSVFGTPVQPLTLQAPPAEVPGVQLNGGWTLISTNRVAQPVSTFLGGIAARSGDVLKGQTTFAVFEPGVGWVGSLTTVQPGRAYMVRVSQGQSLGFSGGTVPANTPIPLTAGWNWLGYLPAFPTPLGYALHGLPSVTGDLIKSQTAFAQFVEGAGWLGSLTHLRPGEGYLMRRAASGSLVYPDTPPPAGLRAEPLEVAEERDGSIPSVSPAGFSATASLIAEVHSNDPALSHESSRLVVVAEDGAGGTTLRGVARFQPVGERRLAFVTVYGDVQDEALMFRLFDGITGQYRDLAGGLRFSADVVWGSVSAPVELVLPVQRAEEIPEHLTFPGISPNPVDQRAVVRFGIPEAGHVRLSVYDLNGRLVSVLHDGDSVAGWQETVFDARAYAAGVYVLRLEHGRRMEHQRVVVVR